MFIHRHLIETGEVAVLFRTSEANRDAFAACFPDVTSRHLRESTFDCLERIRQLKCHRRLQDIRLMAPVLTEFLIV